jgi:hypothetical protein
VVEAGPRQKGKPYTVKAWRAKAGAFLLFLSSPLMNRITLEADDASFQVIWCKKEGSKENEGWDTRMSRSAKAEKGVCESAVRPILLGHSVN